MNDIIMINVKIPAVSKTFDFNVPASMTAADGIKLMAETVTMEYPVFAGEWENLILFDRQCGEELCKNLTFEEQWVRSGYKFVLV